MSFRGQKACGSAVPLKQTVPPCFAVIRFSQVSKTYPGGTQALREVSFEVERGEFVVVLGPSGSGKTTMLKLINRLQEATTGEILVDGRSVMAPDISVTELRRAIGYVFQRFGLFPHFTVERNIGLVPRLMGWAPSAIAERTGALMNRVGLPPQQYARRLPHELSGGQQQRVAFARALAARPRLMLLDEPFGALDPATRDRLQLEYKAIHSDLGLTTVMVTHDVNEALLLADRMLVMAQGAVVQFATPRELLCAPATEAVGQLLEVPRRHHEALQRLLRHDAP